MSTDIKCAVCKNADMRRLVELGWNAKMGFAAISHAFGGTPSTTIVTRHLKEHAEGANARDIPVESARTNRARIEELQRRMLDEIEARLQWAEDQAAYAREKGDPNAIARDFFDVLNPRIQASIASVIKMQDQTDKREGKKASVAVDLMKLMGGTPPPAHLIEDGKTIEGEVVVEDDAPAT